jgi:hypothetical protein
LQWKHDGSWRWNHHSRTILRKLQWFSAASELM